MPGLTITEVRYALSQLGKALIWYLLEVYTLYFVTDILKIPAGRSGIYFLGMMIFDAVTNVLVGVLIDRLFDGRALNRMMGWAIPLLSCLFALSFWLPLLLRNAISVFALLQLTRLVFVCVDVPHNALLLHLTRRDAGVDRLASLRQVMNLAAVVIVASFDLLFSSKGGAAATMGPLAAVVALLGGGLLLVFPRFSAGYAQGVGTGESAVGKLMTGPIFVALALMLVSYLLNSLMTHSLPYAANRIAGDGRLTGTMMFELTLAKLAAAPIIWLVIRRFGLAWAGVAIMATFALSGLGLGLGWTRNLSAPANLGAIALADSGMTIVSWSMIMQAHAKPGPEASAPSSTLMALFTTMGRLGSGASGFLLAMLIAMPTINLAQGLGDLMVFASVAAILLLAVSASVFRSRPAPIA